VKINEVISLQALKAKIDRVFDLAGPKIRNIEKTWDPARGTPVFTVKGKYTCRGWTEWTQGFQFGCAILQFDATGDEEFLDMGRRNTTKRMATHVSHVGVHDHGFNNISTYGNLRRLMLEGRFPRDEAELNFYEMALKVSGAVQASRWTEIKDGLGFIHSFNGPHSLFVDTVRSLRTLGLAHRLGHVLMGENDKPISLLGRLIRHAQATARYNVYYGEGRDRYDVPGRVAHESIFNVTDGNYRCPSSQQGFSPFTTWTRGLAWCFLGFAEQLEFFQTLADKEVAEFVDPVKFKADMLRAATLTADFFIRNSCADGIPFWDTGAPDLVHLLDYREQPSNPDNLYEPVDSSAAAIAGQGFWRLSKLLEARKDHSATRFVRAALTLADTLFAPPYLSDDPKHQGLLLHSVYHRPSGWDYVPPGSSVPNGESSMWGDYHAMEFALLLKRELEGKPYMTFFGP
jgi:hypothetical protein